MSAFTTKSLALVAQGGRLMKASGRARLSSARRAAILLLRRRAEDRRALPLPRRAQWLCISLLLALATFRPLPASAQQQFQGLCARVKIQILQELTLERIGFEAT